jgi:hypothetical protein
LLWSKYLLLIYYRSKVITRRSRKMKCVSKHVQTIIKDSRRKTVDAKKMTITSTFTEESLCTLLKPHRYRRQHFKKKWREEKTKCAGSCKMLQGPTPCNSWPEAVGNSSGMYACSCASWRRDASWKLQRRLGLRDVLF